MSINDSYDEIAVDRLVDVIGNLPVKDADAAATQFQQAWIQYIVIKHGFVAAFNAVAVLYDELAEQAAREKSEGRR